MAHSNLRSFLKSTTPRVRPQFIPKTSIWKLNNQCQLLGGKGLVEYFTLEDLWNCYEEWSAYGAGIPMRLSNHENVVQYYTPFLSGIQIYTAKSVNLRIVREDFEEAETDSTSSDSDAGKLSRTDSNGSNRMWDSDDSWTDPDVDLKAKERLGKLYFQYFDSTSPHLRLPLKNMVNQLAEEHPGLISLRSVDLSSASWMSVAWYPIYHIPGRRNPKELYSAFLTYHTLSSLFQDNIPIGRVKHEEKIKHEGDAIVLPPFGLATYKMQKQVWVNHQAEDRQKIASLFSVAVFTPVLANGPRMDCGPRKDQDQQASAANNNGMHCKFIKYEGSIFGSGFCHVGPQRMALKKALFPCRKEENAVAERKGRLLAALGSSGQAEGRTGRRGGRLLRGFLKQGLGRSFGKKKEKGEGECSTERDWAKERNRGFLRVPPIPLYSFL